MNIYDYHCQFLIISYLYKYVLKSHVYLTKASVG